jgi:hypothetical protein
VQEIIQEKSKYFSLICFHAIGILSLSVKSIGICVIGSSGFVLESPMTSYHFSIKTFERSNHKPLLAPIMITFFINFIFKNYSFGIILFSSIHFKISNTTSLSCQGIGQKFVIRVCSSHFQAIITISLKEAIIRAVLIASFLSGIIQKSSHSFLSIP